MKNQERKYLKVTIDSGSYTGYAASDIESGFIDPIKPWDSASYDPFGSAVAAARAGGTGYPADADWARSKARGQIRWIRLGQLLADQGGLCFFGNVHLEYDGGIDSPNAGEVINYYPLSIEFTVGYDQFDSMIVHNLEDADLDGTTPTSTPIFTGNEGVARLVQRSLIQSYTRNEEVFVPPVSTMEDKYRNTTQFLEIQTGAPAATIGGATVEIVTLGGTASGGTDILIEEVEIDETFDLTEYKKNIA